MRAVAALLFLSWALGDTVAEADDEWFEARSAHFTIVTNAREGTAKNVLEDLEQLRRLVSESFSAQEVDGAKPAVIYLFRNEKSMEPFQPTRDGRREEWAGIYRPTPLRDIVLIRVDDSPDGTRALAFSQYMHLLESYNDSDYPVWLSNGISLFYGNTEISDKRASIGKIRNEYRRVLGEFRSVPIEQLFAVDRSSDYYRDLSKRPLFDAQCWALVHYLLVGQAQQNGAGRLGRFLALLREGREPLLAFQEAMGRPLAEIDTDVGQYIRRSISLYMQVELAPLEMDQTIRFIEMDDIAIRTHEGQLFMATSYQAEAESSLAASIEARPDQVIAHEAMANLHLRQNKAADAQPSLEKAIANGSTNPFVHLRHAQFFVDSHDANIASVPATTLATIRDSLNLVMHDAPELTDAARMYGFLALFDPVTFEDAQQVVTDALARDPGNPGLVFMLGQIHERDGAYAAARTLFRKLLERRLEPGFNTAVRRQLDYAEARLLVEAQQRAAAAAKAAAAESGENIADAEAVDTSGSPDSPPLDNRSEALAQMRNRMFGVSPADDIVEARGKLVRFDCTNGHRFIVDTGDLLHVLEIEDLARIQILENGEHVGTRDFYCGAFDERVVVRYVPNPVEEGIPERHGRLVSIDFIGE